MALANVYAKNYSNRRHAAEVETYKLILFPADNSIAVVKSKQCSPAEHDGFLLVQSGKKRFSGVALEEGTLEQCSKAADRMTKKHVNPEIESDYERVDENHPNQPAAPAGDLKISSLSAIPFRDHTNQPQPTTTTTAIPISTDPYPTFDTLTSTAVDEGSPSAGDEIMDASVARSTPEARQSAAASATDGCVSKPCKRRFKETAVSKSKRSKHFDPKRSSVTTIDELGSEAFSSDEDHAGASNPANNQALINVTPTFAGQRVTSSARESSHCSKTSTTIQSLLAAVSKTEAQYLRPILVAQERTETLLKCLFENQKKIQKTLRKQKMNISLHGLDEPSGSADAQPFLTSMQYTSSDGKTFDLLKRSGVKEHANLYVTSLMDIIFQPDELIALETSEIPKDARYLLLKDAVKNKFQLNEDELETMWQWLHTVVLAKRRTLRANRKKQLTSVTNTS